MSINYKLLPHEGIQTLSPYVPGKPIEALKRETKLTDILKLASNENPLGCSPRVQEALAKLSLQDISHYPAPNLHPIKQALADKWSIPETQITLSNGSDFIFTLLLILFALHNGKHMLTHDKAFMTYAIQAQTLGIPFFTTPLLDNWEVDIQALIKAANENTALIFIANPNNPTGLLIAQTGIRQLLSSIPESCIVVLDEAYYEFAYASIENHSLALLKEFPNLVITRTFSKAYGLAGLRLGYAFARETITELLQRVQLPFTVNQAAMTAAWHALHDNDFLENTLHLTQRGLRQVQKGLESLNLPMLLSHGNFITFDCLGSSLPIYQGLLNHGIIVRPLTSYGMPNHLRVTIGKEADNAHFLAALSQLLSNQHSKD